MIEPDEFIAALEKNGIGLVTGVPDSLLKQACAAFMSRLPGNRHVIAVNEGAAVGLAIGHFLATGRPAMVYMQNSGLGNAVNPLVSLADPAIYGIPMVLMIGWRGEILADGSQMPDEPQHVKQGKITLPQLDIMDIPYRVVDGDAGNIGSVLTELTDLAMARSGPAALVVRKKTFASLKPAPEPMEEKLPTRETAIAAVIGALPDDAVIVSTTGKASRELFELRKASGAGHQRDFLTVGGMGHALQIAAGIAMAKPDRTVACIDGDGAMLMHMGSLSVAAESPNLLHVVINNGAYDSVGGQPTKGAGLDLSAIAKTCGYRGVCRAAAEEEAVSGIRHLQQTDGSGFLEIRCTKGARPDLGRPDRPPAQNKTELMAFIRGNHE